MDLKKFSWVLRIAAAGVLFQTLYFKFTGAPESVFIFSTLGLEPFGRWISGSIELIASILLLIPRATIFGALLGGAVMFVALLSHIVILGIEIQNDGGLLFGLALLTFCCCALLVYQNKNRILNLL